MDLKSALDLATASLTKAGIHHLSTSIYRRETDTLKRKLQQPSRQTGGYGGRSVSGGTHPSQMSLQEKVAATCKDW